MHSFFFSEVFFFFGAKIKQEVSKVVSLVLPSVPSLINDRTLKENYLWYYKSRGKAFPTRVHVCPVKMQIACVST